MPQDGSGAVTAIPLATTHRHPRESGGPGQATGARRPWIPAFAGMTKMEAWRSFRLRLDGQPRQQVELAGEARRYRQFEVAKGDLGQHPAARRALHEALLHEVGFDDLLEHVALLAERGRHRL